MASEYSFQLTAAAQEDFENIVSYMAIMLENPKAASDFADDIENTLADLCRVPLKGAIVENPYLVVKDVRFLAIRQYIIYYLVDMDRHMITVVRIGRRLQDQNKLLSEL